MQKALVIGIIVIGLFIYSALNPVAVVGGVGGGGIYKDCYGFTIKIATGQQFQDAVQSSTYCVGIPTKIK